MLYTYSEPTGGRVKHGKKYWIRMVYLKENKSTESNFKKKSNGPFFYQEKICQEIRGKIK